MTATVNRVAPTVPDFTDPTDENGLTVATWAFSDTAGYVMPAFDNDSNERYAVTAYLWECEPGEEWHGIGDEPLECWKRATTDDTWEYDGPWYGIK